jgi:thioesterase domain-containing protein
VVAAGFKAVRQYKPTPAALNVTVIRTNQTMFGVAEQIEDLGWSSLAAQTTVRRIDGEHLEVFRGNTAMDVGLVVSERCARAGRLHPNRRAFRASREKRS